MPEILQTASAEESPAKRACGRTNAIRVHKDAGKIVDRSRKLRERSRGSVTRITVGSPALLLKRKTLS